MVRGGPAAAVGGRRLWGVPMCGARPPAWRRLAGGGDEGWGLGMRARSARVEVVGCGALVSAPGPAATPQRLPGSAVHGLPAAPAAPRAASPGPAPPAARAPSGPRHRRGPAADHGHHRPEPGGGAGQVLRGLDGGGGHPKSRQRSGQKGAGSGARAKLAGGPRGEEGERG